MMSSLDRDVEKSLPVSLEKSAVAHAEDARGKRQITRMQACVVRSPYHYFSVYSDACRELEPGLEREIPVRRPRISRALNPGYELA
jgi:hypothetical protein